jgi:peptidoglycan/LPS O-acetylase OafA/YrhL
MIADAKVRYDYTSLSLITHFLTFLLGMAAFYLIGKLRGRKRASGIGLLMLAFGLLILLLLAKNPLLFGFLWFNQSPAIPYFLIIVGLGLCPIALFSNQITAFYGDRCFDVPMARPSNKASGTLSASRP